MRGLKQKIAVLFEKLPLAFAIALVSATLLLLSSVLIGNYSLDVLVSNKQKDTSALIFLDLNKTSLTLSKYLRSRSDLVEKLVKKNALGSATHIIVVNKKGFKQTKGITVPGNKIKEWLALDSGSIFLSSLQGQTFLIKKSTANDNTYLSSWRIDLNKIMAPLATPDSSIYLSDRKGKVLFSSDPSITDLTLVNQKNVQDYMKSPLKEQFIKIKNSQRNIFGYGSAISKSNIFLFVEVAEVIVKRKVDKILVDYLKTISIIIIMSLIIIFLSVEWVVGPLKEIIRFAGQIATGNFAIKMREKTFGELRILIRGFNFMTQGLATRDQQIFELIDQQRAKMRMEMELDVAKDLQGNLLPKPEDLQACKGIEIASKYEAAGECAGDWYGVWFDPVKKRNVVCIADVAGHGAGPSMFTAVIASIFFENQSPTLGFDEDKFIERLNAVFIKIGQDKWHATLQLALFNTEGSEVEIVNAGHPFPALIPAEETKKVKRIISGSQPIGIEDVMKVARKKVKLKPGDNLVFYTDGIIEGENPAKEQYGPKRFLKMCHKLRSRGTKGIMEGILQDWMLFRDGTPAPDDVCILSIRSKRGG